MNIYVDKFPESCECCPCNDDYYRCGLSGDLFDLHCIYKRRMKNCKLKQLADVVEVVRCKDCEYGQSYNMFGSRYCIKHNDVAVKDNDFCSYGERADK